MPSFIYIVIVYYVLVMIFPVVVWIGIKDTQIGYAIGRLPIMDPSFVSIELVWSVALGVVALLFAVVFRSVIGARKDFEPFLASKPRKIGVLVLALFILIFVNKFRNAVGYGFDFEAITQQFFKHNFYPNGFTAFWLGTNVLHRISFAVVNIYFLKRIYLKKVSGKKSVEKSFLYFLNIIYFLNAILSGSLTRVLFDAFALVYLVYLILYPTKKVTLYQVLKIFTLISVLFVVLRTLLNILVAGYSLTTLVFELVYFYFARLNFSYLYSLVLERGQVLYPNGTMIDFIVNFGFLPKSELVFEGNEFGRKIGVIAETDFDTGIASTIFSEFYINFGNLGVFFGAFLFGVYVLTLDARSNDYYGLTRLVICAPVALHGLESPITVLCPTLIKLEIMLFIIFAFHTSLKSKRDEKNY